MHLLAILSVTKIISLMFSNYFITLRVSTQHQWWHHYCGCWVKYCRFTERRDVSIRIKPVISQVLCVKCKCLFPLSCCTADLCHLPRTNFFFFLGDLSQSSGLLCHQDRASKQGRSLPVALPRCSRAARCHRTFSSRWSLSCQLPCQPGMVDMVKLSGLLEASASKSPLCSISRCAHTGVKVACSKSGFYCSKREDNS